MIEATSQSQARTATAARAERRTNWRTLLLALHSTLMYIFLYAPIVVLVLFSFTTDSFGARLTVVGNYVAVQIAMDPPEPGALSGIVAFSASLGAFASPSQAPPFYTVFIDGLVNNTQTDGLSSRYSPIPRPSHAAFLLAVLSDELVGSVLLKFYGQGAARILSQFVYPIGALLQPLPLPADVQYIVLKNQTGNVGSFRLVFQIAL